MAEDGYWYGIDGERHGPVSFAQIQALVRSGRLRPADYIWNERHQVWTRVMDFPGLLDENFDGNRKLDDAENSGTAGGFAKDKNLAGDRGSTGDRSFAGDESSDENRRFGEIGSFGDIDDFSPEEDIEYAGFWIRAGAYIIDSLVVGFFTMIWFFIAAQIGLFDQFMALESHPETMTFREIWSSMPTAYYLGSFVIVWIYEALLVSSSWRATVGKRAMGIIVVDHDGERCSFWQATVRSWVKYIVSGIFFLGYLLVLIDQRKQALHDMVARTYCEKT